MNLTKIRSTKGKNRTKASKKVKIKAKIITTMYKHQRIKGPMLIMMTMLMI